MKIKAQRIRLIFRFLNAHAFLTARACTANTAKSRQNRGAGRAIFTFLRPFDNYMHVIHKKEASDSRFW